jgi:cytochrome c5
VSAKNNLGFLRKSFFTRGALVAFAATSALSAGIAVSQEAGDSRTEAAILERIKPVGQVNVAGAGARAEAEAQAGTEATAPAAARTGEQVVGAVCNACHGTGALNAPKIGDGAEWSKRLAAAGGVDGLLKVAIAGKNAMPPRGGGNASDQELRNAIEYMLKKSGVDAGSSAAASAPASKGPMAAAAGMMGDAVQTVTETAKDAADKVADAVAPPSDDSVDLTRGKGVYDGGCVACHGTGVAGAPRLGDAAAWGPRIDQGMDILLQHALNGKGAMPPRGGRMDLSDDDIKSAIAYMVSKVR